MLAFWLNYKKRREAAVNEHTSNIVAWLQRMKDMEDSPEIREIKRIKERLQTYDFSSLLVAARFALTGENPSVEIARDMLDLLIARLEGVEL